MTCTHFNGGLQLSIHRQGSWFSHCLCCGAQEALEASAFPVPAGEMAARAVMDMEQRRFTQAANSFNEAARMGGDPRCHMGALLCQLGVSWCGDEYQPTFAPAAALPRQLEDMPAWQALAASAPQLSPFAWHALNEVRTQLDAILAPMHDADGRSACDVFLCYRRTPGNVRAAMKLYHALTDKALGEKRLRVFCADYTTRGKTQEEFEAQVGHALRTAEYMVILPGDGADALSPWMRNELDRASCPAENRFVASDGHPSIPAGLGTVLSLEEIRVRLSCAAADCTIPRLWDRAIAAMKQEGGLSGAMRLLERASARGDAASRLMMATLLDEGLLIPADAQCAAHYRHLAASADEAARQRVFAALGEVEQALHIARRHAVIYIAADVSDTGLAASQALLKPFLAALQANRRLAGCDVCLVGYDRHARVIEPAKALEKYGLPENAARMLHTQRDGGRDQHAYAAKGLRCCASAHMSRTAKDDALPLVALLSTGATDDAPAAIPAALASVSGVFPNASRASLTSAAQIPGCIAGLLEALH